MSGSLAFANQWGGYAQQAGAALGVDPNVILGQWALESGYGTNTATAQDNNPGAIMSGASPVQYSSAQAFTNAYVNTIANDFPGAVGTGSNATAFADALGSGVNGSYYGNVPASTYASGILGAEGNLTGNYSTSSTSSPATEGTATSTGSATSSGCGILNGGVFTWSCWAGIAADAIFVVLGAGLIFAGFMSGKGGTNITVALPVE